jgi:diaminopimelate epimerase
VFALDRVIASDQESPGVVAMRYWNSDGGAAALCLNGTRCRRADWPSTSAGTATG